MSTSHNTITVVGLGPGLRRLLTIEALETLGAARRIYLHPAEQGLIAELSGRGDLHADVAVHVVAYPHEEEGKAAFLRRLVEAAAAGSLVYAVPGRPIVDELAGIVPLWAEPHGIAVRLVAGLSPLGGIWSPIGPGGSDISLQIVAAHEAIAQGEAPPARQGLQGLWIGSSGRLLDAQMPLLVDGAIDAAGLAHIAAWLRARYPADHAVSLLHQDMSVAIRPLGQVDDQDIAQDGLIAVYVPPLAPLDDLRSWNTLGYITARLRAPGGCPWDREQTHASLTPYMIEEAYEAIDAVERADDVDLIEELGDVLLQVVLHSQLAEEEGRFSLADVAAGVNEKLVRRHPHVFGAVTVGGSSEVLRNWEQIKRVEKGERRGSALDGIPPALPALVLAQTVGRKAARTGFDWPDVEGTLAKVREEIDEVRDAADADARREEIGDLLFALTSVCRHLDVDAEDALRAAIRKFSDRFRRVETVARERDLTLSALTIDDLDALWEEAKADA